MVNKNDSQNNEAGNYVMLVYDIPTRVKANPCKVLRAFGFRLNLSVWVIPARFVPKATGYFEKIKNMPQNGWQIIHYDEREKAKVQELAKVALAKEAEDIRASMETTVARAASQIDDLKARFQEETEAKKIDQLTKRIRRCVKRAVKLLGKAEEAAVAFDLTADVNDAFDATAQAIHSYRQTWFENGSLAQDSTEEPTDV